MRKTLRFTLLSMLLMLCGTSFAQTEFDFDNNGTTLLGLPGESSGSGATAVTDGDITEDKTTTVGDISLTVSAAAEGAKTPNRLWNKAPKLRLYSGSINVKSAGKNITSIVFTLASAKSSAKWGAENSASVGAVALDAEGTSATWTGDAAEVTISIAANTQISKITVNVGGEAPQPVEATEVTSIAALKALESGTLAKLTLNSAKVLFVSGDDAYVTDATGAVDFYKTGLNLTAGQTLIGTITGKYSVYNSLPQFTSVTDHNIESAEGAAPVPVVVALADAKSQNYACQLITIQGLTICQKDGNIYGVIGNDSIQIYDKFRLNIGTLQEGQVKNVTGILVPFKDTFELYNTEDITDGIVPSLSIADINQLTDDKAGLQLKLTDAQVVFVDGKNIYVREGDKAVLFYNTALDLPMNAILNGTVSVDYDNYYGIHELKDNAQTNADALSINEDADDAEPVSVTIDQLIQLQHVCDLVKLTADSIVQDGNNYYAYVGEQRVQLYSRTRANLYKENIKPQTRYDIVALFNNIYKNAPEIDPVQITENTESGISAATTRAAARPRAIYNLAGQRLESLRKGLNIVDGKKVMLK